MAIFRFSLGAVPVSFALTLLCVPCAASDHYPVDWKKTNAEALEYFSRLIHIDTTNPPGNETRAAEYVKTILEQDDIEARILALDPARGNLVARLRGNGSKRPVLIMGHTDTVGIQREKWTVDPFGA